MAALVADALAHEAGAALAFVQLAVARAQVALDAAVVQPVPVLGGKCMYRTHCCVGEVAAIACNLSIDIAPSSGGSQVFGRGGEQPPSRKVTLRRVVTIAQ